ncbi:uncharacterized protein LOC125035401 [Penaeus chinensis]|uniref:uncharacterized protein LOC125035401 n=1 Tax=Penaeus chinensis TaxID=139456 RepID=UPI001FB76712|nr:uncharacterized protein LOC125035401 [Penaeus chinensis]
MLQLLFALALVGAVHADKMFSPPAPPAPGYSYGAPDLRADASTLDQQEQDPIAALAANIPGGGVPGEDYPILGLRPRHRLLVRGPGIPRLLCLTPPRRPAAKCSTSASSTAATTPSCAPTAPSSTSSTSCATGGSTWTAPRPSSSEVSTLTSARSPKTPLPPFATTSWHRISSMALPRRARI